MIKRRTIGLEPWALRETELDLDVLAQTESVFALANGHIGLRGNLDEGEPYGLPGTYLNGFYESQPLPYAEGGYGFPEDGQVVVNVTDAKLIRLLVDDEPFDVRYGQLESHERVLDLRAGVLHRKADWISPAGRRVRVESTRLVSFAQRSVAAISYEVEAVDADIRVVLQSELVANQPLPSEAGDPRGSTAITTPLRRELAATRDLGALLVHSTEASGLMMAVGVDHLIDGASATETSSETYEDEARIMVATHLERGERLRVLKLIAYGWSRQRSQTAIADQVRAAILAATQTGWDGLLSEQRAYLDDFWERADVEIEGDNELQTAVRASMFHCLQASARAERRAIPAKGLTGPGYDGHTFWDTESFVLPMLTYTIPKAAGDALRWRHRTLGLARERAALLGFKGAAFPWRTIRGQECSGYWPAGTAAFHVNADIADATERYQHAVSDPDFERDIGLELLTETARLWRSLGHHEAAGRFRIDGVTGPDEYSAIADNNIYTNLMAQRNLRAAADASERFPERAAELGVDPEEAASWRDAADAVVIPYDHDLDVHCQAEAFTQHQRWNFEATEPDQYPLLLHFPYFDLYRKQVVKQADLVLALHLCGDSFSDGEKERDFDYYDALTVRDSSLSACTQAVIAAEVGHLELAYDYYGEAALIDLDDIEHNTRDGLHIASLTGTWIVAVAGFGGMRDHAGSLTFKPQLPAALTRLAFGIRFRGRELRVDFNHRRARYTLKAGEPLELSHHGEPFTVTQQETQTRPIPALAAKQAPSQPKGRAPERRRRQR
ncbi:MAG TPA: glycosyl hydrolase family 65 protein [Solirubrobacteraceae bacterium]|nr:glycosyl hydrolase family 65 protein [Solirubrobacteraceae bacterium]